MLRAVQNMNNGKTMYFDANTPYEAMRKLVYYLNIADGRQELPINKTVSGEHLYVDYRGETYSIRNR